MAVAGHHLGGRRRGQPQGPADVLLDPGVDVGVGADRARTACPPPPARGRPRSRWRSRSACSAHSENLAPKVVGSACIPWVRPVTGTSMDSRARALRARDQLGGGLDEQVGGPGQGGAQGGVHHVRGGEAVVDPRPLGLADGLLDHVDEGGHVVVGDPLPLGHRLDEGGVDHRGPGPAGLGGRRPGRRRPRPTPRWPAARPAATWRTGPRRRTGRPSPRARSGGSSGDLGAVASSGGGAPGRTGRHRPAATGRCRSGPACPATRWPPPPGRRSARASSMSRPGR